MNCTHIHNMQTWTHSQKTGHYICHTTSHVMWYHIPLQQKFTWKMYRDTCMLIPYLGITLPICISISVQIITITQQIPIFYLLFRCNFFTILNTSSTATIILGVVITIDRVITIFELLCLCGELGASSFSSFDCISLPPIVVEQV